MRPKRRVLIVLLPILVLGGFIWYITATLEPWEPVYQGKPLSYWLAGFSVMPGSSTWPMPEPRWSQASEAVRQIGTNAFPTILRRLRRVDSAVTLKLYALLQYQHWFAIQHVPAKVQNDTAAAAFGCLGPAASNAVPELVRIFGKNYSQDSQHAVLVSLGCIGQPASGAVPTLLQATTHGNQLFRYHAVAALGKIHADPARVVPALVKSLNDPDLDTRRAAILALEEFGADARPAVPELIVVWSSNSDLAARNIARDALWKIDPATAARVLTNAVGQAQ